MENVLEKQLMKVAESIEQKIDQEIQRLDELDLDSIENIREHRLQQMKKMIKKKEEWMAKVNINNFFNCFFMSNLINYRDMGNMKN
jgi:pantothenate kinase-related protein Tda10